MASLPVEEQIRIYDGLDAARKRLNAPVETTATCLLDPTTETLTSSLLRRTTNP